MGADFAAVHDELRAVARTLLGPYSPLERGGNPGVPDPGDLARAGWLGLEVAESLEGSGATFAETAVVLEELGRAAASGPAAATMGLAVGALNDLAPSEGRDRALAGVAVGDTVVAVAVPSGDQAVGEMPPQFRAVSTAGGAVRVHGRAEFVMDAAEADAILLVVTGPDGRPGSLLLPRDTPGLVVSAQPVLDPSRSFATVEAADVEAPDGLWCFADEPAAGGRGVRSVGRLLDRAAAAVACDSLGVAGAALDATVSYAGARRQFGRPIGSFQAVKHACADMLVEITVGRQLLQAAVDGVAAPGPAGDPSLAVSRAKSHICEAAVRVTGRAMQLHGGIGYTWERGIHVYLKRASLNRSLFGSPAAHRRRLARRYAAR